MFSSPGDPPNPGIKPRSPALQADTSFHQVKILRNFKQTGGFTSKLYFCSASQVVQLIKNPPANARDTRDTGSALGLAVCPEIGNSNPLQYSCLENPMDRGVWQAIYSPWGCKESDTAEQLSMVYFFLNAGEMIHEQHALQD